MGGQTAYRGNKWVAAPDRGRKDFHSLQGRLGSVVFQQEAISCRGEKSKAEGCMHLERAFLLSQQKHIPEAKMYRALYLLIKPRVLTQGSHPCDFI